MKNATILLAVAVLVLAAPSYVRAAHVWEGDISDNWSTAGNWDLGGVPGYDTVNVNDVSGSGYPQPVIRSNDDRVRYLYVSHTAVDAPGLKIVTGGDLDVYQLRVGWKNNNDMSYLLQTGGAISQADQFDIGYGNPNSKGRYRIEGGTFSQNKYSTVWVGRMYNWGDKIGAVGRFEIKGNPTVNPISITAGTYNQGPLSTLRIEVGSNGIAKINVQRDAVLSGTLEVVVSAGYSGPNTIDVLTANTSAGAYTLKYKDYSVGGDYVYDPDGDSDGTPWADLVLDDASIAAGYVLGNDGNTLQVTIPEPATMMLLGIGGISVLLKRRRKSRA